MSKFETYENFPLKIAFFTVLFSIIIYLFGAYILFLGFGIIFATLYLFYCFIIEIFIVFRSCKNCYYYGKICGLCKGKIAPVFVKKGNIENFVKRTIKWYHMLPDFMVIVFPVTGGIYQLFQGFTWIVIILVVIMFLVFMGGTSFIRGSYACKYCKQREIGCPAQDLFKKKKKK